MKDKHLVLYAQSTTGKGGDGGQKGREGTWFFTPSQPQEKAMEDKNLVLYAQSTTGKGDGGQTLGSLRHQPQEKEEMEDKHLVNAIL